MDNPQYHQADPTESRTGHRPKRCVGRLRNYWLCPSEHSAADGLQVLVVNGHQHADPGVLELHLALPQLFRENIVISQLHTVVTRHWRCLWLSTMMEPCICTFPATLRCWIPLPLPKGANMQSPSSEDQCFPQLQLSLQAKPITDVFAPDYVAGVSVSLCREHLHQADQ